jgi:hypothetical protein
MATVSEIVAAAQKALDDLTRQVEAAKQAATVAVEAQNAATSVASDAQSKLAEILEAATKAVALRTEITDNQAIIASKSAHIQDAQEHADKVRAELDRVLTAVTQKVTEAEGLSTRVESASKHAAELLAGLQSTNSSANTNAASVVASRDAAKDSAAITKALADRTEKIDARIADYEKRLAELEVEAKRQLTTIVGLLPGATSAGLAHAFDERRQTFLKPHGRWQFVFVASLLSLVFIAATGLWHIVSASSAVTYDELLRVWLARLPIAAALIWLALYASHESSLAKRLEEDYGYKATIAASFEGFNKQMSEIAAGIAPNTPLAKLCTDTLTTIGTPPGHIYEKHCLSPTPASEIREAITSVLEKMRGVGEKKLG